jgi:hypothetical protein
MRIVKFTLNRIHTEQAADYAKEYKCLKALNSVIPGMRTNDIEHLKYRPIPKRPTILFKYEPKDISRLVNMEPIDHKFNVCLPEFVEFIYNNGATEIDASGRMIKKKGVTDVRKGSAVYNERTHKVETVWIKQGNKDNWNNVGLSKLPEELQQSYSPTRTH